MIKSLLVTSWRNIWRNKRRSIITISAISTAIFFVVFYQQMNQWFLYNNIDTSVSAYAGYIQVTDTAYVDEASIDNAILTPEQIDKWKKIDGVRGVFPRVNSFALASIGVKSKNSIVMGITPELDNSEMQLDKKIKAGKLLESGDQKVLITEQMSQYYNVTIGDSLILYSIGYQGALAANIYEVKGILNMPSGPLANTVYMDISEAQYFYGAFDLVTSVIINIDNTVGLDRIANQVKESIKDDPQLVARTWKEALPGLSEGMEFSALTNKMIAFILLFIVSFGIFGTIVMLCNERQYEFGILNAIGMTKTKILTSTLLEVYLLALLGVFIGSGLVSPLLYYLNTNPIELTGSAAQAAQEKGIDPIFSAGMYPEIYLSSAMAILGLTIILSGYIVWTIIHLKPIDAMRKK